MAHQAKLTVVPLIIARGNYNFLFLYQKGAIFEGRQLFEEAIISNVSHRRSCPKYFVLLSPLKSEIHEHYHRKTEKDLVLL